VLLYAVIELPWFIGENVLTILYILHIQCCWENLLLLTLQLDNWSSFVLSSEYLINRQSHMSFFEKSDLFFVCLLRPLSPDIQIQELEIEAAKVRMFSVFWVKCYMFMDHNTIISVIPFITAHLEYLFQRSFYFNPCKFGNKLNFFHKELE